MAHFGCPSDALLPDVTHDITYANEDPVPVARTESVQSQQTTRSPSNASNCQVTPNNRHPRGRVDESQQQVPGTPAPSALRGRPTTSSTESSPRSRKRQRNRTHVQPRPSRQIPETAAAYHRPEHIAALARCLGITPEFIENFPHIESTSTDRRANEYDTFRRTTLDGLARKFSSLTINMEELQTYFDGYPRTGSILRDAEFEDLKKWTISKLDQHLFGNTIKKLRNTARGRVPKISQKNATRNRLDRQEKKEELAKYETENNTLREENEDLKRKIAALQAELIVHIDERPQMIAQFQREKAALQAAADQRQSQLHGVLSLRIDKCRERINQLQQENINYKLALELQFDLQRVACTYPVGQPEPNLIQTELPPPGPDEVPATPAPFDQMMY